MNCHSVGVALPDADGTHLRISVQGVDSNGTLEDEEFVFPVEASTVGRAFMRREIVRVDRIEDGNLSLEEYQAAKKDGVKSFCVLPLISRNNMLGLLTLASFEESGFRKDHVDFLTQIAKQVAIAVENALAYQTIADLKDRLAQEKLYLEEEVRSDLRFEGIVGTCAIIRKTLRQVETVALTDSTVLLLGETGTGKELIARAIHEHSPRRGGPFVRVDCATIPAGLLESELFGHEKGAFTSAVSRHIGRFQLANQGTVFLDEVGEIPIDLQPKLLRVLQEREFEPLGSGRTVRTDTRIIAATNRDLSVLVEEMKFRADLYYRLSVFPIRVPALRERIEDIPLLVRHFTQYHARRLGKSIDTIPSETILRLQQYFWPGNVRELQNLVERAVILSNGPILQVPLAELKLRIPVFPGSKTESLAEAERRHILQALEECRWVIAGPNGAAAKLGIKRSTLQFRMQKLGIIRPDR